MLAKCCGLSQRASSLGQYRQNSRLWYSSYLQSYSDRRLASCKVRVTCPEDTERISPVDMPSKRLAPRHAFALSHAIPSCPIIASSQVAHPQFHLAVGQQVTLSLFFLASPSLSICLPFCCLFYLCSLNPGQAAMSSRKTVSVSIKARAPTLKV